ncbi:NAD-dependent epimerase/dehydratase family protein [Lichenihabitans sp. Uapishka_5]|uniref:NAD-dependent epimerase/dehydratase family protein n=1 Tax=Lichenihabitans sp. Uapishka_5 TaxID=3037302 RepID=UPI0029E7D027|nr:NAD-dependent epimerase/dehydratase family protein [Lichenihabitans sp. Uapishka_5]MDX7952952.1 NAD-dependent epimerase/dehydratase family protein [Lichenihabitans sp. Uapishka_5]
MTRALIGHTGFVGSNLVKAGSYDAVFNSTNFRQMSGRTFEEIVCAGISAVKWQANKEPERDWQQIQALLDVLVTVKAERFTLISTIDVYPDPSQTADEAEAIQPDEGQPYGKHRLAVERFIKERFASALIARLPALFGPGLKKNVVFDLLHGNQTDKINLRTRFQWYPLDRLADDLQIAGRAGLRVVNLFPEPIETGYIVETLFPHAQIGPSISPAPFYDLRTRHAGLFGGQDGYIMDQASVLDAMRRFVTAVRSSPDATKGRLQDHG